VTLGGSSDPGSRPAELQQPGKLHNSARRKDPFGATLGTETRRSARPHVLVLIFCLFLFLVVSRPPYCLALDNKTPFKLRHKTKTTYACQSWSFPPSLPRSFIFPSFCSSRLSLLDNAYRHKSRGHAVAVRSLICLVLAFLFALNIYSI
jgi:hypothetical protein